jgi:predicted DNA-binding transcriptional regulator AlpA
MARKILAQPPASPSSALRLQWLETDPMNTTTDRIGTEQIAQMFGVSRKTVTDRWIKAPDFPKPVQVISRKSRWWSLDQVKAWRAGQ